MAVVPIVAGRCPECSTPLDESTVDQPALFVHGGYGATEQIRVQRCPACGWQVTSEVSEVRP